MIRYLHGMFCNAKMANRYKINERVGLLTQTHANICFRFIINMYTILKGGIAQFSY